jgi:hypothetical protein
LNPEGILTPLSVRRPLVSSPGLISAEVLVSEAEERLGDNSQHVPGYNYPQETLIVFSKNHKQDFLLFE